MDNVDNRKQTHRPRVYISTPETAVFYVETDVFTAETAVFLRQKPLLCSRRAKPQPTRNAPRMKAGGAIIGTKTPKRGHEPARYGQIQTTARRRSFLACAALSPFAVLHCKPRAVSCSRRQTPQSLNNTRHAPPRVEAIPYTPRPEYGQRGQYGHRRPQR